MGGGKDPGKKFFGNLTDLLGKHGKLPGKNSDFDIDKILKEERFKRHDLGEGAGSGGEPTISFDKPLPRDTSEE